MRSRAVLALALAGTLAACSPFDDAMVALFGRSMRDQPSFDPYENPHLPAENAVPVAVGNYPQVTEDGRLVLGEGFEGREAPFTQLDVTQQAAAVTGIENPVEATPESLARGEEMFLRFCAPCHGPDGSGATGYVVDNGMPPMPLTTPRVQGYSDGLLYGLIAAGRGIMPAYGHRILPVDRWHVVNYVRQLQRGGGAAADTAAAGGAVPADTAAAGVDTAAADTASGSGR